MYLIDLLALLYSKGILSRAIICVPYQGVVDTVVQLGYII